MRSESTSPSIMAYEHVLAHRVPLHDMKRQIERECVTRALEDSNGNITHAAKLLGMKRPRVSQLVKQYGLMLPGGATEEDEE
jgi:sigma-54 specific flagellar transcriptional regulator A